jgi:hypothetical protein
VFELLKEILAKIVFFVKKKRAGFPPLPEGRRLQPED